MAQSNKNKMCININLTKYAAVYAKEIGEALEVVEKLL